jgi:lactate dehydrogenase-like 2-hydroxyacid dehydrogenase
MSDKPEVLLVGAPKKFTVEKLQEFVTLHILERAKDGDSLIREVGDRVRAAVVTGAPAALEGSAMARLPKLELVSSFGVGYDNIDTAYASAHGITVTNTPDVLTEEVADTALGLLLCTVREFPQAERYLRDGKWMQAQYPLTNATLRNRKVGMVGMGRIGKAIARRLDAFLVPVVYHSRNSQPDVTYRHYPNLADMAREVDTLIVITPGGAATRNLISNEVLDALGPNGIVINMARGTVVDDDALIEALKERRIYSAGLDVFLNEPEVPKEYLEMEHLVLFPHLGSATVHTRTRMEELVVDNVAAWAEGHPPLTPVAETPWPPKRRR